MASRGRSGRLIPILVLVVVVALGGFYAYAHNAIVQKVNADYASAGPVSARLSRFKSADDKGFAIFWKLRFEKGGKHAPSVGVFYLKPFGKVELEGAKR